MNDDFERVQRGMFKGFDSVQVHGGFDFNDERLDRMVKEIMDEGKKDLVIDFTYTTYLTSTGIAILVKLYKKVQSINGHLYIGNATDDMISLIRLARLDKYVEFIS
jgi:anti-anti-sigma factor